MGLRGGGADRAQGEEDHGGGDMAPICRRKSPVWRRGVSLIRAPAG